MHRAESVEALILGAGPAGLAAAYRLSKAGVETVILERSEASGGLMRSISRGDFIVDIGRKEMYSRIPVVDRLWRDLLGNDYRTYEHRIGILFDGHIVELSPTYRGVRRGIPRGMFLASVADLVWSWARPGRSRPRNYEEYWYQTCGRRFSRIFAQGFWEKFRGIGWAEMSPPPEDPEGVGGLCHRIGQGFSLGFSQQPTTRTWRHPARGTGQVCELLEREILDAGGRLRFNASVTQLISSVGRITGVNAKIGTDTVTFRPAHVVAAMPIEILTALMSERVVRGRPPLAVGSPTRAVVLVYLFLDERPRFPHAWLEVTSTKLKAGRVTNYAAFGGDMVPPGKSCLCVEFFCPGQDSLLELKDEIIAGLALRECASSRLIDPLKCFDWFVLKLPGTDAATSWRDWQGETRRELLADLRHFENLYFVNRPGTDQAIQAGLEAAGAILLTNRAGFDGLMDLPLAPNSTERTWAADLLRARQ
jgi:protoporphyrinogen oxidase